MATTKPTAVDIARALRGTDFPAGKQDLITQAKSNSADEAVLQVLQQLPEREYTNMADVEKEVGKII